MADHALTPNAMGLPLPKDILRLKMSQESGQMPNSGRLSLIVPNKSGLMKRKSPKHLRRDVRFKSHKRTNTTGVVAESMNDRSHLMSVIDDPMTSGFDNFVGPSQLSALIGPHTMIAGEKSRRLAAKHGLAGLSVGGSNGRPLMSDIPFTHN